MKKLLICLLLSLLLVGCSNNDTKKVTVHSLPNEEKSINSIIEKDNYIIVDVRTKEEYEESHIKGAINIPCDEINENIKLDKSKTIMVYCKSGTRSNIAYNTLISLGYDSYDMGAFDNINLDKE